MRSRLFPPGFIALALLAGGCGGNRGTLSAQSVHPTSRPVLPATYRPSGHAAAGDVFVHLFEWKWTDIAAECQNVLGPAGYRAVQISPPQEHLVLPSHPWWVRYQPVSYSIDRSRSGTRAEFTAMVERCRAAGVDIYVDAVINHTAAVAGGTGSNGTRFTKYEYPGLYTRSDFRPTCVISDYQNIVNVQDCELVGLSDLRTEDPAVQEKIASYLIGLVKLGVAGFRIDAAKHMQPVQLDAIINRVHRTLAAERRPLPYWFAEVIDHGGEPITARDYFGLGFGSGGAADITEFKFRRAADMFLGREGRRLAQLNPNGPAGARFSADAWGMMPSDKAVIFLENHDTQRGAGISYRDGDVYRIANVWMLAQPYGYPSVMSSYAFDRGRAGHDAGPPSDAGGATRDVQCAARMEAAVPGEWVCEHRDPAIARMIGFRRAVAGADINRWWDNGGNAIAFSRGNRGFVAINSQRTPISATIPTGLPAGVYCEVLSGGRGATSCAGATVTVDVAGNVQVTLAANAAIAIHAGARLAGGEGSGRRSGRLSAVSSQHSAVVYP